MPENGYFGSLAPSQTDVNEELDFMRRTGALPSSGKRQGGLVQMLSGFASNPFGALSAGYDAVTSDPVGVAQSLVVDPVVETAQWWNDAARGRVPLTDAQGRTSPEVIERSMDIAGIGAGGGLANTAARGGQMPNTFGMAGGGPVKGDAVQQGVKKGIRAYHGSPHDFDKFSIDQIGTGEGAQAYGHGLYFAENEGVARGYRDRLGGGVKPALRPSQFNDVTQWWDEAKELFPDDPKRQAAYHYLNQMSGKDSAVQNVVDMTTGPFSKNTGGVFSYPDASGNKVSFTPDEMADLADEFYQPGKMYEVNINADPEDFLDWDAPYSEQPESVRRIADSHNLARSASGLKENTGQNIYRELGVRAADPSNPAFSNARRSGADYAATPVLQEQGIPGIKYLDQGSRAAGEGSRNYVVFDDSMVEILRKYGLAGLALTGAGAGAFGSLAPKDNQQY